MTIEKINSIKNSYITNSRNINLTAPQKFKKNENDEQKKLSKKEVQILGVALFAATIAIGLIGQKRGWWKPSNKMPADNVSSSTATLLCDI